MRTAPPTYPDATKLVLLDRDGVINTDIAPHGTLRWEDFTFIEGSLDALRELTLAGFTLAIVTNQSAVGKGLMTLAQLEQLHSNMLRVITQHGGNIAHIYSCTDHPDHPSPRRKPAAGMVWEALHDFHAQPHTTPMVGDALRDMQAAQSAGCPRILVRTGKGCDTNMQLLPSELHPITVCADLRDAAEYIICHHPHYTL
jgi:D-glycero-D-manno-heptose 1,7-bisphosphate phosphatase